VTTYLAHVEIKSKVLQQRSLFARQNNNSRPKKWKSGRDGGGGRESSVQLKASAPFSHALISKRRTSLYRKVVSWHKNVYGKSVINDFLPDYVKAEQGPLPFRVKNEPFTLSSSLFLSRGGNSISGVAVHRLHSPSSFPPRVKKCAPHFSAAKCLSPYFIDWRAHILIRELAQEIARAAGSRRAFCADFGPPLLGKRESFNFNGAACANIDLMHDGVLN
jgi:hypothetical protein